MGKIKLLFITLVSALPFAAFASLGGNDASISADQQATNQGSKAYSMAIATTSASDKSYTVHTITEKNGITLQEFSSNDKVFAITWAGTRYPNLTQDLGVFSTQIKTASKSGDLLNNVTLTGEDFVLHMGGNPGFYYGKAYVPSLVPSNVNIKDIK